MKIKRETTITFEREDMCELILNSLLLRDTLHNIVRQFILEDDTDVRFEINGYDIKLLRMYKVDEDYVCREKIDITPDEKQRIEVVINLYNDLNKLGSVSVMTNISKDSY